jgi:hypothetical protein
MFIPVIAISIPPIHPQYRETPDDSSLRGILAVPLLYLRLPVVTGAETRHVQSPDHPGAEVDGEHDLPPVNNFVNGVIQGTYAFIRLSHLHFHNQETITGLRFYSYHYLFHFYNLEIYLGTVNEIPLVFFFF